MATHLETIPKNSKVTIIPAPIKFSIETFAFEIANKAKIPGNVGDIASVAERLWRELEKTNSDEQALTIALQKLGSLDCVVKDLRRPWLHRILFERESRTSRILAFLLLTLFSSSILMDKAVWLYLSGTREQFLGMTMDGGRVPFELLDIVLVGIVLIAPDWRGRIFAPCCVAFLIFFALGLFVGRYSQPYLVSREGVAPGRYIKPEEFISTQKEFAKRMGLGKYSDIQVSYFEHYFLPIWVQVFLLCPKLILGIGLFLDSAPALRNRLICKRVAA